MIGPKYNYNINYTDLQYKNIWMKNHNFGSACSHNTKAINRADQIPLQLIWLALDIIRFKSICCRYFLVEPFPRHFVHWEHCVWIYVFSVRRH